MSRRVLFHAFFRRLLDNDLVPEGVDSEDALSWLVPLFAAPAAMVTLWLFPKYALLVDIAPELFAAASRGDRLFFLGYSMAAVGFLTLLVWEGLLPDRRDAVVLGALPIRGRTVVAARLMAFSALLVGFAFAINVPAAFGFAFAAGGAGSAFAAVRLFVAHLATTVGAGVFVALSVVVVQATLFLALPARVVRTVSVAAQLVFVVLLLEWLVFAPGILARLEGGEPSQSGAGVLSLLPPIWFLDLYDAWSGIAGTTSHLASRAIVGTVLALGLAAAACGWIHARMIHDAPADVGRPSSMAAGLARRLVFAAVVRHPTEQAVVAFVAKSLTRSRRHRLVLAVYVAVALAFIIGGFLGPFLRGDELLLSQPGVFLLSIPLVLSFFVLVGLRVLFTVPAELGANWLFQMTESDDKSRYLSGVRKAMLLLGPTPIAAATFPVYLALWGMTQAVAHTVFWVLLSAALVEVLLLGFRKVPFTCPFLPGKANAKLLWPLYLLAMLTYGYAAAQLQTWLLKDPWRWAVSCAVVMVGLTAAAVYRKTFPGESKPLVYHESRELPLELLDLGRP